MRWVVHGEVDPRRAAELEAFAATHRITEQVFRDLDRAGFPYDVVAMDEYTIDLVVAVPGAWLVYDTT